MKKNQSHYLEKKLHCVLVVKWPYTTYIDTFDNVRINPYCHSAIGVYTFDSVRSFSSRLQLVGFVGVFQYFFTDSMIGTTVLT